MLIPIMIKLITKIMGNIVKENIFIKYPKQKTEKQKAMDPLILIFPYLFRCCFTKLE